MARKSSPVTITSVAQLLLCAKSQEFELPMRGAVENAATNNRANSSTGNSADNSSPIANPDAASPGFASSSGSPTNAKSEADEAEARMKEADLRAKAIRHMAQHLADKPNGSIIRPPPWYRRDEDRFSIAHNRPLSWVKDWETGKIRPRAMMDDFKKLRMDPMKAAKAAQPEIKSKKRKAPVEPDSNNTINRVCFYREKRLRLVPTSRNCTTSWLTLNPNKIVSVETKIDAGYYADVESDSD